MSKFYKKSSLRNSLILQIWNPQKLGLFWQLGSSLIQCSCPNPLVTRTAKPWRKIPGCSPTQAWKLFWIARATCSSPTNALPLALHPTAFHNFASCSQREIAGLAPRRSTSSNYSCSFLLHSSSQYPQTARFVLLSLTSNYALNVTINLSKSGKTPKQFSWSERDPLPSSRELC